MLIIHFNIFLQNKLCVFPYLTTIKGQFPGLFYHTCIISFDTASADLFLMLPSFPRPIKCRSFKVCSFKYAAYPQPCAPNSLSFVSGYLIY